MIEYAHLQAKCELEASFPPCEIYPWVDHYCVLAPPRQMLLDTKHVKNTPECPLLPLEWQVWGLHCIGSWRHTCKNKSMKFVVNVNCWNWVNHQVNEACCRCELLEQSKPPNVAMLACSLVFLNFSHRHHLIQSSNLMLCCVWLDWPQRCSVKFKTKCVLFFTKQSIDLVAGLVWAAVRHNLDQLASQ